VVRGKTQTVGVLALEFWWR